MLATGSILTYLILTLLMTAASLLFLLGVQSLWKSVNGHDPRKVEKRLQALARQTPAPQNPPVLRAHATTERTALERRLLRLSGPSGWPAPWRSSEAAGRCAGCCSRAPHPARPA